MVVVVSVVVVAVVVVVVVVAVPQSWCKAVVGEYHDDDCWQRRNGVGGRDGHNECR